MGLLQRVVIPLSLTESDEKVLRYASMVARLSVSREFHFVHVLDRQKLRADDRETVVAIDRIAWLVEAHFQDYSESLQVTCEVRGGSPRERILEFLREREADLVLTASRHGQNGQSPFAAQWALSGGCSVWAVPDAARDRIERILAPVDFSDATRESLSLAALLGRLSGLEECLALPVGDGDRSLTTAESPAFRQFLRGVNTYGLGIVPVVDSETDGSQAIMNYAQRQAVDLIVLGTSRLAADAKAKGNSFEILDQSAVPVLALQAATSPPVLNGLRSSSLRIGGEEVSPRISPMLP